MDGSISPEQVGDNAEDGQRSKGMDRLGTEARRRTGLCTAKFVQADMGGEDVGGLRS